MNSVLFMVTVGLSLVVVMMLVLWLISILTKNAGYVDLGWVLGLVILASVYTIYGPGYPIRKLLILSMVALWGARLSSLLIQRFLRDQREDSRYQKIRQSWGARANFNFFFFFQFQGLLDVLLSVPVLLACFNVDYRLSIFELLGLSTWVVGILGESLADEQLRTFKMNPANKGKTCQSGFWYYSRHPNYFFEWLIWVGYFIFALGSPWGWLSVISPLIMLHFLLNVSGVPLAEEQSFKSRGEEYRAYQRTTSVFVPWFKKKLL